MKVVSKAEEWQKNVRQKNKTELRHFFAGHFFAILCLLNLSHWRRRRFGLLKRRNLDRHAKRLMTAIAAIGKLRHARFRAIEILGADDFRQLLRL